MRLLAQIAAALALIAVLVPAASASQLIDRNATDVTLQVNRDGVALITDRVLGETHSITASGAVNAIAPTTSRAQVAFKLDYGVSTAGFENACTPVRLPLPWLVTACRAADGSSGRCRAGSGTCRTTAVAPNVQQAASELRLSHWTGALPTLTIRFGWAYHRFLRLYGPRYKGQAVHGFRSTSSGAPLDTFGRNIYVDTYDSAYGAGWKRENSFLTHERTGGFCYGFYPHGPHPVGTGARYRATVVGPGVTPDVSWEGVSQRTYSPELDRKANADWSPCSATIPPVLPLTTGRSLSAHAGRARRGRARPFAAAQLEGPALLLLAKHAVDGRARGARELAQRLLGQRHLDRALGAAVHLGEIRQPAQDPPLDRNVEGLEQPFVQQPHLAGQEGEQRLVDRGMLAA